MKKTTTYQSMSVLAFLLLLSASKVSGQWTTATLSQARYDLAAAAASNKVFFGGGTGSTGPSNVVDIYDNVTHTWSTTTLSQARQFVQPHLQNVNGRVRKSK